MHYFLSCLTLFFLIIAGDELDNKEENDVVVIDVSPSSQAKIHDIMFTPPGSAGLVRNESSEIEVFAAKDLDFAIDDEGKVTIILGQATYKIRYI